MSKVEELKEMINELQMKKSTRRCTYKEFMACNPLPYKGEIDPITCRRWISSTEAVFVRSRCEVEDQVMFATGPLQLQAKDWWDAYSKELGDDKVQTLTWQEFKEPFLKYHSPQSAIDKIQEDFLRLRQKDETIDEITNKFLDKVKFCGEIAGTERSRILRYHAMLKAEYREFVNPSKCETLSELIDCARDREIELRRQVEREEKRVAEKTTNRNPSKRQDITIKIGKGRQVVESRLVRRAGNIIQVNVCWERKGAINVGKRDIRIISAPRIQKRAIIAIKQGTLKQNARNFNKGQRKMERRMSFPRLVEGCSS
ncbi:uncharacterized protein LOC110907274 [Helianthus annuus]|uniref:uncharacterized protein LOC110907274 n=1 Tax=Helianthus annuus TaxID=4232 RepID=UPI000B904C84|nr:uncharacterized protein LOC110907274 [Helianthus annuus]